MNNYVVLYGFGEMHKPICYWRMNAVDLGKEGCLKKALQKMLENYPTIMKVYLLASTLETVRSWREARAVGAGFAEWYCFEDYCNKVGVLQQIED